MAKRKRIRRPRLNSAIAITSSPIFLLKSNRRIASFNRGCEELTGWTSEEVVGALCEYTTDVDVSHVSSLTSTLCPPPAVFSGQTMRVPVQLIQKSGRTLPRQIHYFPLPDQAGEVRYVLGIITTPEPHKEQTTPTLVAQRVHAELTALRMSLRRRYGTKSLICRGQAMKRVLEQIRLARTSQASVFLWGESGTGKEHIARIIHYEGETQSRSFVPLDCKETSRWELKQALRRIFEQLDHEDKSITLLPGTIYLRHVERIPRDVQEELVSLYQREPPPQLRLICSSTQSLWELVEQEELLEDCYYLLTTLTVEIPPLRQRSEDLIPLAQYFLERANPLDVERQIVGFTEQVLMRFQNYNWPGNVRELSQVIAEARQLCTGNTIQPEHLPFRFRTGMDAQQVEPPDTILPLPLEEILNQVERKLIETTLRQCRHNKSKAANLLGLTRPRMYRRMEALGIADSEPDEPEIEHHNTNGE